MFLFQIGCELRRAHVDYLAYQQSYGIAQKPAEEHGGDYDYGHIDDFLGHLVFFKAYNIKQPVDVYKQPLRYFV